MIEHQADVSSSGFKKDTIIGVHISRTTKTISFYKDSQDLGIAFRTKSQDLKNLHPFIDFNQAGTIQIF